MYVCVYVCMYVCVCVHFSEIVKHVVVNILGYKKDIIVKIFEKMQ